MQEKIITQSDVNIDKAPNIDVIGKITFFVALIRISRILFFAFLTLLVVSVSGVLIYRIVPPTFTPLMLIRSTEQISGGKAATVKHKWVSINDISPNLVLAVVASEDNNFLNHFGIDLEAVRQAKTENTGRRRPRGASTITQQTAKNVFLYPKRSYIRKGLEAYFSILIEVFWGKKRIMEVYLNMIEMGDGIYGAEAAARTYYNKPASRLTRHEAALIAAILPNPRRWDPRRPTNYLYSRQQWILWNMNNIEKVDF